MSLKHSPSVGYVSLSDLFLSQTYTSIGWLNSIWLFSTDSLPVIELDSETPNSWASRNENLVSLIDAKKASTYSVLGWEFVKAWAIKENVSYPTLIKRGTPILGIPGESLKRVVFVDKHEDGTMFYNGEIYRSMKMSQLISKFVGEPGEEVTQVWEGEKQKAPDGKTYVFIASGVQDPDFPGGYGGYTDEKSRTVTLRSDRSIDVNFYYTEMELPSYNYLMRVAVPDGIAHIAIMKADVSSIKVKMHDGSICSVDIVLPDDEQASPIRVMLPTGIYALKKIEIND